MAFPECDILPGLSLRFGGLFVVPGAAHLKEFAQIAERHLGVLHGGLFDHGVPLPEWYLASPFFRISFSRASLPQNLSCSAIFRSRDRKSTRLTSSHAN